MGQAVLGGGGAAFWALCVVDCWYLLTSALQEYYTVAYYI